MGTRNPLIRNIITPTWVRPDEWLDIPDIIPHDEAVYLLVAVYEKTANLVAFLCIGNYNVDWGDGNTELVSSGVKAQHDYDSDDLTTTLFRGYKQALIVITPATGENLTKVDIQQYHSDTELEKPSNLLDIVFKIPYVSGTNNLITGGWRARHYSIERHDIREIGVLTSGDALYYHMHSLQSITPFDTSQITSAWKMFSVMYNYTHFDGSVWNFSSLLYAKNMFIYNASLVSIKNVDLSNCTNTNAAFARCSVLTHLENITLGSSLDGYSLFAHGFELTNLEIDLNNVVDARYLLYSTSNLRRIVFQNCGSITNAGAFKTSGQLSYAEMHGMRVSFSLASNKMSGPAIDILGESVADMTGFTTPSVTLTGNPGVTTMDQSIWLNKNWTIIGV